MGTQDSIWRASRSSSSRKGSWQCYIKCWNWSFQIWTSHRFSYIGLWQWPLYGRRYLWSRQWFLIVSRTSAVVLHTFINHYQYSFVLYFVPFSDNLKDHNYLKVMLTDNSHIFSFLPLFFMVKAPSTLSFCLEQDVC